MSLRCDILKIDLETISELINKLRNNLVISEMVSIVCSLYNFSSLNSNMSVSIYIHNITYNFAQRDINTHICIRSQTRLSFFFYNFSPNCKSTLNRLSILFSQHDRYGDFFISPNAFLSNLQPPSLLPHLSLIYPFLLAF